MQSQRYEKVEKIGEGECVFVFVYVERVCSAMAGTYGTVYKAKDRETGEVVAMKIVRLDEDDEVRAR